MKKKIDNVRLEINCYSLNTENTQLAETIFDQIAEFVTDKIKELSPGFKPQTKITKEYKYEKEVDSGYGW